MSEIIPESNDSVERQIEHDHSAELSKPIRERLDATRQSITHHFTITCNDDGEAEQIDGYIIVGLFEDGRPGELFIKIAKQGSTISGLMNTVGILTSMALQYGVPIEAIAGKLEYMRFEPSGRTTNEEIRYARSVVDYIYRWLGNEFSESYRADRQQKKTELFD